MHSEHITPPILRVENLESWYGESHVLHGVQFEMFEGEVVTLLGRNGAGKTTTLRSIMGMLDLRQGSVRKNQTETITLSPEEIARLGLAICPEERGIFSSLSVLENLMLPPVLRPGGMSIGEIFSLFPNLQERLGTSQGTKLSGGEQQMLAIARILRTGADLILLDEPTEGLAPVIIQQIAAMIRKLKERGMTILMVEQNFKFASTIADRFYVMEQGRVVDGFRSAELASNSEKLQNYLGV
jgi:branched-chain amino acid transport system ATP-binding protein